MNAANKPGQIDVLLVEDRPEDARSVRATLKNVTNRLHTIGDAVEALAYLRKDGPYRDALDADLVLLSAGLAGAGATRVLEALTGTGDNPPPPVIVMQAPDAGDTDVAGASARLNKPFSLEAFIDALNRIDHPRLATITAPRRQRRNATTEE